MAVLSEIVSGAAGAIVGACITLVVAQRKLHADNVTGERTKWRDKMRVLALRFVAGDTPGLWCEFALHTNPTMEEDLAIVRLAKQLDGTKPSLTQANEMTTRLALLLKHDWERAKRDSSWWPLRCEPKRTPYQEPIY